MMFEIVLVGAIIGVAYWRGYVSGRDRERFKVKRKD